MFEKWFPLQQNNIEKSESRIELIYSHLEQDSLDIFVEGNSRGKPSQLWNEVKDYDTARALQYEYEGSNLHKNLLKSLQVDPNTIVYKGTKKPYVVPNYYAATMQLMDPITEVMRPITSAAQAIKTPAKKPRNLEQVDEKWTTETGEAAQPVAAASSQVEATSEHQHAQREAISNFNLDIFTNSSPSSSSTAGGANATAVHGRDQDRLDPELLELATMDVTSQSSASSTEATVGGGGGRKRSDDTTKLSKLLATIKSTSKKHHHQEAEEEKEALSEEAKRQLSNLPDLSYMRSSKLVFPIRLQRELPK